MNTTDNANKEFKNSPYNLVKKTNRRKEFIIAHADAIKFAERGGKVISTANETLKWGKVLEDPKFKQAAQQKP